MLEISRSEEIENTTRLDNTSSIESINAKLARISFALDFLKQQKKAAERLVENTKKSDKPYKYEPYKESPFSSIKRMSFDDFDSIADNEADLLSDISDLEDAAAKQSDFTAKQSRLAAENEILNVYFSLETPFSFFADTKECGVVLGAVPQQFKGALTQFFEEKEIIYDYIGDGSKMQAFAVVALKENLEEIITRLQDFDFVKNTFSDDKTPSEMIKTNSEEIKALENKKIELMNAALSKEKIIRAFKTLYDYYLVELQKYSALDGFAATKKSFVLEGWYAAENETALKEMLDCISDSLVYEFRQPEENEVVPTFVRSKKIVAPYESITNMFSVPNYRGDIDPNPIMAFFYFLFFGIMLADAGYGLLLAIGGFVLYKVSKPVPGKGKLLLVITMGGISTAIWGIMFGGWFGLTVTGTPFDAVLFSPLDEPLIMLGMCLALGFVQILIGMLLNAINLIRKHRVMDALCEVGTWYLIFIGLGLVVLNALLVKADAMKFAGIAVMATGAFLLVLSNVRGKKGSKVITGFLGGFGKLYNGVNILSDILSYARLFGLSLSGGVVAMVINQICGVIIGFLPADLSFIGYIISIPIFAFGHLFNIGISALGAYVHDSRLQFIEFYGKFYEGGGHLFVPFGSKIKYTYLDK